MSMRDLDRELDRLEAALHNLPEEEQSPHGQVKIRQIRRQIQELLKNAPPLTPAGRVYLARHPRRPGITDYIGALFESFIELKGDRLSKDDPSILGGIALYHGQPVTVIGHRKGKNLNEHLRCNFGMPGPEGYRKALRLMKQAEKFRRPVITFIDTPGAYPGLEAEAGGQSEAIARNLAAMSTLSVPIMSVVTGEGSSGGALAIGVADCVLMLENAVYSILSPEGFASILWKDASRSEEACALMRLTAQDLSRFGVIDAIVPEPPGGAHRRPAAVFESLDTVLSRQLARLQKQSSSSLTATRYKKLRQIGAAMEDVIKEDA